MNVQVLLSCMHQKDYSIINQANLQTDSIIINQADEFKKEVFQKGAAEIIFLTLDERGVGLSRNNALMRSTADIILFADEDMTYVDGYEAIVLEEFRKNSKADMIVFNVPSTNPERTSALITSPGRVRRYNCLKYGTVRMAVKAERLKEREIFFSLLFGGGAKYSSGEDSKLIYRAIKSGMRVYASPRIIGYVTQEGSSWFEGYTKKFFVDKGVLYRSLSPRFHIIFSLRFILKNRKRFPQDFSLLQLMQFMIVESKEA